MKNLLLITLLILLPPILILSIFIQKEDVKFYHESSKIIRVKNEETGIIEKVPFEKYIKGVLAGEMGTNFELEALKAQAIAARSYALFKMQNTKDKEYDVVNTVTNQVYLSDEKLKEKWQNQYEEKDNKLKRAVDETKGKYMMYEDQIVEALFFSTSSGQTENSEDVFLSKVPYLRSVSSDDSISPVYTDTALIKLEDFYRKLDLKYDENLKIEILERTVTGRIKKLKVNGQEFGGRDFQSKLSLRSNHFDIKCDNKMVTINTKGFGHGVGMSQYGAQKMAQDGYKYSEILKHYYTNIKIVQ